MAVTEMVEVASRGFDVEKGVEGEVEIAGPEEWKEMQETSVEVDTGMLQERFTDRAVEQIADVLVPQILQERISKGVKVMSQERVLERIVGHSEGVPVSPITEERLKVIQLELVERIQEVVRRTVEKCHRCSLSIMSPTSLLWSRGRSAWTGLFRRLWRFPSCNSLIRWLMSLLCWSYKFHS